MPRKTLTAELVVEGKDDQHVVWALCVRHNLPETFVVVTPGDEVNGIDELLDGLPVRLKRSGLTALGLVIDADQGLQNRWQAVCARLAMHGYVNLPAQPDPQGTIIHQAPLPRLGVWLMPDNQLPGMLEDFVAYLIPGGDPLQARAHTIVAEIERDGLRRFNPLHRPKALIHTWLAWQERPGLPMGQAITTHALLHDAPLARTFVEWLQRLFLAP